MSDNKSETFLPTSTTPSNAADINPSQKFPNSNSININDGSMNSKIEKITTIESEIDNSVKQKNEHFAILLGIFIQLIWAINSIQLKTVRKFFPAVYSNNSLTFYRNFPTCILGYLIAKKKKIEIPAQKTIKNQLWFHIRNITNYLCMVIWVAELKYLRLSTCQCICSCQAVLVIVFSIFILKEKFYTRYIYGLLLCIIGSILILKNERTGTSNDISKSTGEFFFGICLALCHLTCSALTNISQKILCNDGMKGEVQCYYNGLYGCIFSGIAMIISWHTGLSDILYVLYSLSNGIVFYIAIYLTAVCFTYIDISKFMPLTYLCTVFIFILGVLLLNELIYVSDIVGSLLIIGFQLYHVKNPL